MTILAKLKVSPDRSRIKIRMNTIWRTATTIFLLLLGSQSAWADWHRDTYVWYRYPWGDDRPHNILAPPKSSFEWEIRQLPEASEIVYDPFATENWCWRIKGNQLTRELAEYEKFYDAGDVMLNRYRDIRRSVLRIGAPPKQETAYLRMFEERSRSTNGNPDNLLKTISDARLPEEHELYLRGAAFYRVSAIGEARAEWKKVLELNHYNRPTRTVWAAWMLAKTSDNDAEALQYFAETRRLADDGFEDLLGLASAADGWIASDKMESGDSHGALSLHFQRAIRGDDRGLATILRELWPNDRDGAHFGNISGQGAADSRLIRRVANAGQLSNHYRASTKPIHWSTEPDEVDTWLQRLFQAREQFDSFDYAQAAEVAYFYGYAGFAEMFLRDAADTFDATWVRGKLAAAKENYAEARFWFESAVREFPHEVKPAPWDQGQRLVSPELDWWGNDFTHQLRRTQFWADLAELRLADGDYLGAIDAAQRQGPRGFDLRAYLIQNVLDLEEAIALAKAEPVRQLPAPYRGLRGIDTWTTEASTRELVAHRLVIAERFDEAREFFLDTERRDLLDWYEKLLLRGRDENAPRSERANALWLASLLCRRYSSSLFSISEIPLPRISPELWSQQRDVIRWGYYHRVELSDSPDQATPPPTADEWERQAKHGCVNEHTDHPRIFASSLAWEAARLMPDNDVQTAVILHRAGTWLKYRYPKKADRFYKALVLRNGEDPLARESDTIRWFVNGAQTKYQDRDWDMDLLAQEMRANGLTADVYFER